MFIESFAPPPRMLIFGAVDFTAALVRVAKVLGYHVTVCDAREVFATRRAVPDGRRGRGRLAPPPARAGRRRRSGPATRSACSPTTTSSTCPPSSPPCAPTSATWAPWAAGAPTPSASSGCGRRASTDAELARVMAPIGLDLGARTPEETAVSICAEIIALRTGREAPSLRDGDGAIHAGGAIA